jgi:hypothetical protein
MKRMSASNVYVLPSLPRAVPYGNRARIGRRAAARGRRAGEPETCDAAHDGGAPAEELRARQAAILAKGPC